MKKTGVLLTIAFLFANGLYAQSRLSEPLGSYKNMVKTGNGIDIATENATVSISFFNPSLIKVSVSKQTPDNFSYAVIQTAPAGLANIIENTTQIELTTAALKVVITKSPILISFYNLQGEVLNQDLPSLGIRWQGTEVTNYKKLQPSEKFIGLGEKTGDLNRFGTVLTNWNTDHPAYGLNDDPLYQTQPFYMGIHGNKVYGIFFDNSFKTTFNFGASNTLYSSFAADDGNLVYYFFGAPTVAQILNDYTWLIGRSLLPPLWSLGYQQCKWSYYPESEVLSVANTFRNKKLPCDVIYLDIHYMDAYKVFTFSPERFPNPKHLTSELDKMGFKLAVIIDPGIKIEKGYKQYDEGVANDLFIKYPDGTFYNGSVWPGPTHFPDYTNPETRKWWGESFKFYIDNGVVGFWNDMNEPAVWGANFPSVNEINFDGRGGTMREGHNLYGLQMARSTYEGTKKLMNRRPLVITRAGYAGVQRYSSVWTGDNFASDEHMLLSARMVSNMGLAGIAFAGPDVGGFMGDCSAKLFTRWITQGVFTPFFRGHNVNSEKSKEPWAFGDAVESHARNVLNLRYQLLPYIYSAFYTATQTGMPVARSLAIDYTFDEAIYKKDFQNEYFFGPAFLVTPISSEATVAKIYLPKGNWYRYTTQELYEGGKECLIEVPMNDLPVFVKESSLIPMQTVVQNTSEMPSDTLFLKIYKGSISNIFTYYEDDGVSYEFEQGAFLKRDLVYNPAQKSLTIGKPEGSYTGKFKSVKLMFIGFDSKTVIVNKKQQALDNDNALVVPFAEQVITGL
ncbi:MAG: glycoside hydrolase family 31 protein [Salinivirgaceae bacterium]